MNSSFRKLRILGGIDIFLSLLLIFRFLMLFEKRRLLGVGHPWGELILPIVLLILAIGIIVKSIFFIQNATGIYILAAIGDFFWIIVLLPFLPAIEFPHLLYKMFGSHYAALPTQWLSSISSFFYEQERIVKLIFHIFFVIYWIWKIKLVKLFLREK